LLLNMMVKFAISTGVITVWDPLVWRPIIDIRDVDKNSIKAKSYRNIPKNWDYIFENNSIMNDLKDREGYPSEKMMLNHVLVSRDVFKAKIGRGQIYPKLILPKGLKKEKDAKITLDIPSKNKKFVERYKHNGKKFGLMLGGSRGSYYSPSIKSWIKLISKINDKFPGCKIYVTGVRKEDNSTITKAYTKEDIEILKSKFDNVVDCYDIGLWNQIALLDFCDVFISPHTGFAFLASCVNTPWLEIAGGSWPAYLFNHVPFYSVLPNNKDYPYYDKINLWEKYENSIIPCYSDNNFKIKIPEMIKGIQLLLDKKFTYKKALSRYKKNIEKANTKLKEIKQHSF